MATLIAVERWLKATDVYGLHNAAVVPMGISRRQNGEIVGSEVVGVFLRMRHYCRLGCPCPREDCRGKMLLKPRSRRPLGFAYVRAVFFTWDAVGAATWEMIDDARLFLHGKFVFGLNQLLSEISPRPNRC